MTARFDSVAAVLAAAGAQLGSTDWMTMGQQRIDQFAEATDDRQWIHVDPERAAGGPFGACVAHGYLTLGLANRFRDGVGLAPGDSAIVSLAADAEVPTLLERHRIKAASRAGRLRLSFHVSNDADDADLAARVLSAHVQA